jgi:hypothetical protein
MGMAVRTQQLAAGGAGPLVRTAVQQANVPHTTA